MKTYKNCPNCGGTLDDVGRCKYCDSKVYDFCDIDLTRSKKTYLRVRTQGQIITAQVIANPSISISCETDCYPVMTSEFVILKAIVEESEVQDADSN